MKKNFLKTVLLVALTASVLTACGQKPEAEENVAEVEESVTEADAAEEESNINPPYLAALERYDSVISQLKPGQAYGFVDMCSEYDVLLVADDEYGVYDDQNGNKAAIAATIYGISPEGNVEEFSKVNSGGTAYPLAAYDGCLMVVNNASTMMEFIDPEVCSVITKKCVEVSYDEDGNASYSYMDADTQTDGVTDDDSMMNEMYDMYKDAVVINFTVVE